MIRKELKEITGKEMKVILLVRVHIGTCKECRKKYMKIVKHMKEQEKEAKE